MKGEDNNMGLEWDLIKYAYEKGREDLSCLRIVRNLNHSVTKEQLEELFSKYGKVKEVDIQFWENNKWLGCVVMSNPSEAKKAKEALDGYEFKGRILEVCEVYFVLKSRKKEIGNEKYKPGYEPGYEPGYDEYEPGDTEPGDQIQVPSGGSKI